jgi:two-component system chemotaxis response regulator CheY
MPFATALKVLIVDDKPAVRQVTRLALEKLGVRLIHEAGNGSVGLQKAVVQPLDLIISEFSMPKMDGLQLLRAIRGHPAVRKLPFILISGRGDREFVVTAAQAGVNTYLIKPFTDRILREKIEEVVGRLS